MEGKVYVILGKAQWKKGSVSQFHGRPPGADEVDVFVSRLRAV